MSNWDTMFLDLLSAGHDHSKRMNGATSDLSVTYNLYSAQCAEVIHPVCAGRSRPVLDGGNAPSHCAAVCLTWTGMQCYTTPCPAGRGTVAAAALECRRLAAL